MMQASLPNLFLIPMLFTLTAIGFMTIFYSLRKDRTRPQAHSRIYRCSVCSHVYVDSRDVPLSRCPRCDCLNEAVKR